jgi:hypothetical protein
MIQHLSDFFKALGLIAVILIALYMSWIVAIVLVIIALIFIIKYVFTEHRKFKDSLKEGD